jgi:hypothetical protein
MAGGVLSNASCPMLRALEGTRTPGLQVRNLSLYPLSYERMNARPDGSRSTPLLYWRPRFLSTRGDVHPLPRLRGLQYCVEHQLRL